MDFVEKIKKALGNDKVITDRDIIRTYLKDETAELEGSAEVVVRPKTKEDIRETIIIAKDFKIPVTPRGAGTGVSGGAVPIKGGIVLSTEQMDRIIEIDKKNRIAVVEPGVITGRLQEEVEKLGLFYPPDPASLDSCTIGGNVAENAGGPRAVKYGVTKNYVTGIEFVTGNGNIVFAGGKLHKNVTGYDLLGILIGSEGTLGIFTKIFLKLLPLPNYQVDILVSFEDIEDLINAFEEIFPRFLPVNIEFAEKKSIQLAQEFLEERMIIKDAGAYLIIGFDGNDMDAIEKEYVEVGEICMKHHAIDVFVADNKKTRERLWKARRSMHDAVKAKSPVLEREDVVVPVSELKNLIYIIRKLSDEHKMDIIAFGHAGDGNVHVNILKGEMSQEEWRIKKEKVVQSLLENVVVLGGTISGEHGIGVVKRRYLSMAVGEDSIKLYRAIKSALDPQNILNPGKII